MSYGHEKAILRSKLPVFGIYVGKDALQHDADVHFFLHRHAANNPAAHYVVVNNAKRTLRHNTATVKNEVLLQGSPLPNLQWMTNVCGEQLHAPLGQVTASDGMVSVVAILMPVGFESSAHKRIVRDLHELLGKAKQAPHVDVIVVEVAYSDSENKPPVSQRRQHRILRKTKHDSSCMTFSMEQHTQSCEKLYKLMLSKAQTFYKEMCSALDSTMKKDSSHSSKLIEYAAHTLATAMLNEMGGKGGEAIESMYACCDKLKEHMQSMSESEALSCHRYRQVFGLLVQKRNGLILEQEHACLIQAAGAKQGPDGKYIARALGEAALYFRDMMELMKEVHNKAQCARIRTFGDVKQRCLVKYHVWCALQYNQHAKLLSSLAIHTLVQKDILSRPICRIYRAHNSYHQAALCAIKAVDSGFTGMLGETSVDKFITVMYARALDEVQHVHSVHKVDRITLAVHYVRRLAAEGRGAEAAKHVDLLRSSCTATAWPHLRDIIKDTLTLLGHPEPDVPSVVHQLAPHLVPQPRPIPYSRAHELASRLRQQHQARLQAAQANDAGAAVPFARTSSYATAIIGDGDAEDAATGTVVAENAVAFDDQWHSEDDKWRERPLPLARWRHDVALSPARFAAAASHLKRVHALCLSDTFLTGSTLKHVLKQLVKHVPHLHHLDLSRCNLRNFDAHNLSKYLRKRPAPLHSLNLWCNNFEANGMAVLAPHFPSLRCLNLGGNPLGDEGLKSMIHHLSRNAEEGASSLVSLGLRYTNLDDAAFVRLSLYLLASNGPRLVRLDVLDNHFSDTILPPLKRLVQEVPQLATLRISPKPWLAEMAHELSAQAYGLCSLGFELHVRGAPLTFDPAQVPPNTSLAASLAPLLPWLQRNHRFTDATRNQRRLNWSQCQAQVFPKSLVVYGDKLRRLDLSKNRISCLPPIVAALPTTLRRLNLSCNQLRHLPEVAFGAALRRLNLANNALTELPDAMLAHMPHLEILDVSHNRLTALPASVAHHPSLEELWASYNRLTRVDTHVATLFKLRVLDVAHNAITWVAPTVCHLPLLETMCLAHNNLRELPTSLVGAQGAASKRSEFRLTFEGNDFMYDAQHRSSQEALLEHLRQLRHHREHFRRCRFMVVGEADAFDLGSLLLSRCGKISNRAEVMDMGASAAPMVQEIAVTGDLGESPHSGGEAGARKSATLHPQLNLCVWNWLHPNRDVSRVVHGVFASAANVYVVTFTMQKHPWPQIKPWMDAIWRHARGAHVYIVGTNASSVSKERAAAVSEALSVCLKRWALLGGRANTHPTPINSRVASAPWFYAVNTSQPESHDLPRLLAALCEPNDDIHGSADVHKSFRQLLAKKKEADRDPDLPVYMTWDQWSAWCGVCGDTVAERLLPLHTQKLHDSGDIFWLNGDNVGSEGTLRLHVALKLEEYVILQPSILCRLAQAVLTNGHRKRVCDAVVQPHRLRKLWSFVAPELHAYAQDVFSLFSLWIPVVTDDGNGSVNGRQSLPIALSSSSLLAPSTSYASLKSLPAVMASPTSRLSPMDTAHGWLTPSWLSKSPPEAKEWRNMVFSALAEVSLGTPPHRHTVSQRYRLPGLLYGLVLEVTKRLWTWLPRRCAWVNGTIAGDPKTCIVRMDHYVDAEGGPWLRLQVHGVDARDVAERVADNVYDSFRERHANLRSYSQVTRNGMLWFDCAHCASQCAAEPPSWPAKAALLHLHERVDGDEGKSNAGAFKCSACGNLFSLPQLMPQLPHGENVNYAEDVEEGSMLGEGGYGFVVSGFWKRQKSVAIKRISKNKVEEYSDVFYCVSDMCHEVYMTRLVSTLPNAPECVVRFQGAYARPLSLLLENVPGGDLRHWIATKCTFDVTGKGQRDWPMVVRIGFDVARALLWMHTDCPGKPALVHRDVKPDNVFIVSNTAHDPVVAKLGDFGETCVVEGGATGTRVDNLSWKAPESAREHSRHYWSTASDVYSFGIVLWQMVAGIVAPWSPPWRETGAMEGQRQAIPEGTPRDLVDLIRCCWAQDERSRPQMHTVVNLLKIMQSRAPHWEHHVTAIADEALDDESC